MRLRQRWIRLRIFDSSTQLRSRELDVLAKLLCNEVSPGNKPGNIYEYRQIITAA
jgi:hypothetical protein